MLELDGLTYRYGKKKVLQGVSLSLETGRVYGIAGANGSGKTTLFDCIAGLISPDGRITSDVEDLHRQLVYLRTTPYMMPLITGREYIMLICRGGGVTEPAVDEKNIFSLPLDEYAYHYSTGMKKKLALTAVLHLQREVYLLDEPFNGVDMESNLVIQEVIRKLRELGKTVLVSSHIFHTLADICDEIHLLSDGQIVQSATPDRYDELHQTMKGTIVGDKVEKLDLR